ncbi:hypothetical protein FD28_GL001078 [Levilactobacillus hammesii DSM 16381]|uniref:Uncharacterized protein n=1 Tax=Levilactobacillus hammesii DSM 16381 TaxID=1423753 RepID=A0A0R1UKM8_9LACO|nr:hypothetical protein FD28_GL001078 [Levilactobacillus hammesii DSM 16381]
MENPTAEPKFDSLTANLDIGSDLAILTMGSSIWLINSYCNRRRPEMEAAVTTVLADVFRLTPWDAFGDR